MNRFELFAASVALSFTLNATAQKELTNEVIWYSPTFSTEYVGGLASMNDGQHYTAMEGTANGMVIHQYAYTTGEKVATLVEGSTLIPSGSREPVAINGYSFSGDEKKMMIETESEPIYRHSYFAYNYVYDRASKKLAPLSDISKAKQRLATFSPDGSHAAFVRDNNIYSVDLATMAETQVTTDGEWNKILNGLTDWVYEEEFSFTQGFVWSPNGTKILYLRSDETGVKEFNLTTYKENLYPTEYRFKYPKAGEDNSVVSLHVYTLATNTTTTVPLGVTGDIYLPRFGWTANDQVLWYMRMNRLQNEKVIATVDLAQRTLNPEPKIVYQETSKTYIEVTDDLYFIKDGSGFVLSSERDGWNHIYSVNIASGKQLQLTRGGWDVIAVNGIDEANQRVIFTAAKSDPKNQDVLAVPLNGKGVMQLSPLGGTNDPEFSTGFRYFINTRSTLNTPPVITLHNSKGKQIKLLKDNTKLAATVKEYGLVTKEFFTLTTDQGIELNGWMMKPPAFDSRQKYPVFMTQYSGPNSNEVLDQWGGRDQLWHGMLAQKGYLVVCVDPRGTGRRGHDFRHITYGQLGKYETIDQIASAKWLGKQPYVDATRIGIQGWSYGGYMSSLCITKGADVFKAAIAVAPVTNWRYYDSIYTERYMGLPKDNGDGYDDNSPINHVEKLKGKYLLIHGLADDNVHYQNSAEMTLSLVKANKPFDQFMYPDKNHGIYGGTTRVHLFSMMTDWLVENL